MKKSHLLIQCLVFLFIITSCSNSDDGNDIIDLPVLLKKTILSFNNGDLYKTINHTYENNKLKTISFFDENNILYYSGIHTYENNMVTKIEQFNESNELVRFYIPEYSTENQLIKYTQYNETNNTAKKYVITYNSNNVITKTIYEGDYNSQTTLIGETTLETDQYNNITKITTNSYTIDYSYDQKNSIYKNIESKKALSIMDLLNTSPLDRGVINNALSYEYNNTTITDHLDFSYTYNNDNFPTFLIQNSPTFGEGLHIEYQYE